MRTVQNRLLTLLSLLCAVICVSAPAEEAPPATLALTFAQSVSKEAALYAWEDACAIAYLPANHSIRFPDHLIPSGEGTMPDGRAYRKYTFLDSESDNLVIQQSPLPLRSLVRVGNDDAEEIYLLFARTCNGVRAGQNDEIYRKAAYSCGNLTCAGGTAMDVMRNAYSSAGGTCALRAEWPDHNFLYWDASENRFLTLDEWRDNIHRAERLQVNDEETLPKSAADALNAGFIKLPAGDSIYHQMYKGLTEYELGACLKFIAADGREAVYQIVTDANDKALILTDPLATILITLKAYPETGPTFNYAPNDFSDGNGLSAGFFGNLSAKLSANSIAHYYFDLLPYYWWGN